MATRLSFRAVLYDTDTYPGTYPTNQHDGAHPAVQGGNGAEVYGQAGCDSTSVHRLLTKTEGDVETQFAVTTMNTLTRDYYVSKFITEPLKNVTQINSNQWISHFAIGEDSLSMNYGGPFMTIYVWRPSGGGSLVGTIYSWTGCGGFGEPPAASSTTHYLKAGNLTAGVGSQVLGVQDGDVIICELWMRMTSTVSDQARVWYDGNLEYVLTDTGLPGANDINAYLETPQDITFEYEFPDEPVTMDVTDTVTLTNKFITKV